MNSRYAITPREQERASDSTPTTYNPWPDTCPGTQQENRPAIPPNPRPGASISRKKRYSWRAGW